MSTGFSSINFHTETTDRFKKFAIQNDANYTETLEAMLDFFEENYISPFEPFDNSVFRITDMVNKRMDAVEMILRAQEVKYHKPTLEMLLSLFSGNIKEERPLLRERKQFPENNQLD